MSKIQAFLMSFFIVFISYCCILQCMAEGVVMTVQQPYAENNINKQVDINTTTTETNSASAVNNVIQDSKQYVTLNGDVNNIVGNDSYYNDLFNNSNRDINLMFAKYKGYNLILKDQDVVSITDIAKLYIDNGFYQKIIQQNVKLKDEITQKSNLKISLDYIIMFNKLKWSASINGIKYKTYNKSINGISILSLNKRSAKILYTPHNIVAKQLIAKKDRFKNDDVLIKNDGSIVFSLSSKECFDVDTITIEDECGRLSFKEKKYKKHENDVNNQAYDSDNKNGDNIDSINDKNIKQQETQQQNSTKQLEKVDKNAKKDNTNNAAA